MTRWRDEAAKAGCARFGDGEVIDNVDHNRVRRPDHKKVNKRGAVDHEAVSDGPFGDDLPGAMSNPADSPAPGARHLSDADIAAMHLQHSEELRELRAELATLRAMLEAFANDNEAPAWAEASGIHAGLPRTLTGVPSPQLKRPRAWRKPVTGL